MIHKNVLARNNSCMQNLILFVFSVNHSKQFEKGVVIRNGKEINHLIFCYLAKQVHVTILDTTGEQLRVHQQARHFFFCLLILSLILLDSLRLNNHEAMSETSC